MAGVRFPGLVLALLVLLTSSVLTAAVRTPTRHLLQQGDNPANLDTTSAQQLNEAVAAAVAAVLPAAQGIDQNCLLAKCGQPTGACLGDTECQAAVFALQACRSSTSLVQLVSQCNPKPQSYNPTKPIPPLMDQCVNIASYWYKDNARFYDLTRCAQNSTCLTGISPKGCTPWPWSDSNKKVFRSSKAEFEAVFDAMAASNKRWEFVMHAHFGWCLRGFKLRTFTATNNVTGKTSRTLEYTVNVNISRRAFPNELKSMPGGKPLVRWTRKQVWARWDERISSYRMEMFTAGVFESDPWLVLSPYPPFTNTTSSNGTNSTTKLTPQAVLLLSAVNVGPIKLPAGEFGAPDGTVFAPVGGKVPPEAYSYWSKLYGLDFANTWCDASRLWW
ncbi:hypothetical protein OEZ86_013848 [Tetradesmus obliquus]|nr:hypothetical protein OEZ86_013848 [Tetradesmus obliquus]